MDLEVRTQKAIARGPFVVIHWGQKLGYRVYHLALKPKVLSLGGSWPLDDGYFTCEDERWVPETISMVSGPSTTGLKVQGCVIPSAELGAGQLASDMWVLDFSLRL